MGWRGPVTHRQFAAWMLWLDAEWEQPTKLEWHLLQLTAEVVKGRIDPKHHGKISASSFKMKFKPSTAQPSPPEMTPRQRKVQAQIAKAGWLSVVGKVEVK